LQVYNEYKDPTFLIEKVVHPEGDPCRKILLNDGAIKLTWCIPDLLCEPPLGIGEREAMSLLRHVLLVQRGGGTVSKEGAKHLPLSILKLRQRRFIPHLECEWEEGKEVIEKSLMEAALPEMVAKFSLDQEREKEAKRLRKRKKALPKIALPGQLTLNAFISQKKKTENSAGFVTPVRKITKPTLFGIPVPKAIVLGLGKFGDNDLPKKLPKVPLEILSTKEKTTFETAKERDPEKSLSTKAKPERQSTHLPSKRKIKGKPKVRSTEDRDHKNDGLLIVSKPKRRSSRLHSKEKKKNEGASNLFKDWIIPKSPSQAELAKVGLVTPKRKRSPNAVLEDEVSERPRTRQRPSKEDELAVACLKSAGFKRKSTIPLSEETGISCLDLFSSDISAEEEEAKPVLVSPKRKRSQVAEQGEVLGLDTQQHSSKKGKVVAAALECPMRPLGCDRMFLDLCSSDTSSADEKETLTFFVTPKRKHCQIINLEDENTLIKNSYQHNSLKDNSAGTCAKSSWTKRKRNLGKSRKKDKNKSIRSYFLPRKPKRSWKENVLRDITTPTRKLSVPTRDLKNKNIQEESQQGKQICGSWSTQRDHYSDLS